MHESNIVADGERIVAMDYTNHRGERRIYNVIPHSIAFGRSHHHAQELQWYLFATDVDRNVTRTFAMKDVHSWAPGGPAFQETLPMER